MKNNSLRGFLPGDNYFVTFALLLTAAFCFILRPSIRGHDGVLNYAYLRSALIDHDLDFTNDYAYYLQQQADWFDNQELPRDPVTNRPINLYGVGSAILWSPWVVAAHAWCLTTAHRPDAWPANGFSYPYEEAVGLGSCFYATVGLLLVHALLRSRYGKVAGFWGALAIWLASPLFFYMYLHPSMSHANSFFLAALLLWLYVRGDGLVRWTCLGFVAGLLASTRFQDAILLAGIAVGEAVNIARNRTQPRLLPQRLIRYLLATAAAIVTFTPQLIAWHYLQGSAFSGPRAYLMQGTVHMWAPVHAFQVLFSARHGLFYWHPMLLLAFAGLLLSVRRPWLRLVCLAMFAAELWVISCWSLWWAGASFGHRLFISALPALSVGAAAMVQRTPLTRRAGPILIIFLTFWNFGYVVQYGSGMINRQGPIGIRQLFFNNLVRIPALFLRSNPASPSEK